MEQNELSVSKRDSMQGHSACKVIPLVRSIFAGQKKVVLTNGFH